MREEGLDLNRVWNSQFQIYMWRSHNLLTDQIISKVNWSCVSLINEKWKEKKKSIHVRILSLYDSGSSPKFQKSICIHVSSGLHSQRCSALHC